MNSCKIKLPLFLLVLLSFWLAKPLKAQVFVGPTAAAMGSAGRAGAEAAEGVFFNPAVLSHIPMVKMGAFYSSGQPQSGESQQTLAFSLIDGNPEAIIPGAVNYLRRSRDFEAGPAWKEELWQVSVGQFVLPRWALGASLFRFSAQPEEAWGGSFSPPESSAQWNGNLGLLYTPRADLGLALTYHNLLPSSSRVAEEFRLIPHMGLGANYLLSDFFRLRMDLVKYLDRNPDSRMNVAFGFESLFSEFFALRLGSHWDEFRSRHSWTAGLGFRGPRFLLDYSLERHREGGGAVHSVDLRLPFW